MGIAKRLAALTLALTLCASVIHASGFENTGVGAKARAMGGAFRAIANDWTAAYYNPAGYAFIYDNMAGGALGLFQHRFELVPDYRLGGVYETGIINDTKLYNKHETLGNPSAGVVLQTPLLGETVVGFSIYQPFDANIEWTLYDVPKAYNDSIADQIPDNQFVNNLDVVAFQLTLAKRFSEDKLALGIGLQVLRADLRYRTVTFRENPLGTPYSDRPRDRIVEFTYHDGYSLGFGLTAGMLYQLNEQLNIALTASLPFDITIDGESNAVYFMPFNDQLDSATQRDPVTNQFVGGDRLSFTPDFETKLQLPPSVGIGLAFSPSEKLTVALDGTYTLWSRFEGLDFAYSNWNTFQPNNDPSVEDFFTTDLSSPTEWNDAGRLAVGVAYKLKENITLLGGVSGDQSANRDVVGFTPQFIDTGDKYAYNVGIHFELEHWDLTFATSYIDYPELKVLSLQDLDGDGNFDSFPGTYRPETFETIFSFNYRF